MVLKDIKDKAVNLTIEEFTNLKNYLINDVEQVIKEEQEYFCIENEFKVRGCQLFDLRFETKKAQFKLEMFYYWDNKSGKGFDKKLYVFYWDEFCEIIGGDKNGNIKK